MNKNKFHPFFCHIKGCRKNIKHTPEYLDNRVDANYLHSILHYLKWNDREGFNKYIKESKINTSTEEKETVSEMFFYRVVGWPEGNRYYAEASENWQATLFEGFRRDYTEEIKKFLNNFGN
jgi:hypothetical protein